MPSKLEYVQDKNLGPADDLREKLVVLEEAHFNIKTMDASQALALLRDLDDVTVRLANLTADGLDARPEQGRFQAVQGRLKQRASSLLNAIGGPQALSEQRPSPPPPAERWWWYIDALVAGQKQRLWRRLWLGLVIVVVVLGGLLVLFNTVLAPSPEAVARVQAEQRASAATGDGNYQQALAALDDGLAVAPNDAGLLIFKGITQQHLQQNNEAEQTFAEAQKILNNPLEFYLERAQLYLRFNQLDPASQDIEAALKLNDQSARSWLLQGQVFELQGQSLEAIETYEHAGQLAFDQNENEIYVMARMGMVRVGQMPPAVPSVTPARGTPESQ